MQHDYTSTDHLTQENSPETPFIMIKKDLLRDLNISILAKGYWASFVAGTISLMEIPDVPWKELEVHLVNKLEGRE